MRKITKRIAVIGTTTALAIGGGLAWAAWSATGGGTSTAQATTAHELVASPGSAGAQLYPGSSTDVNFTVANPNAYPVKITSVSATNIVSNKTGCAGTNVVFTAASLPVTVPQNATAAPVSLTGALKMIADANDACQGATFTLTLSLSGESAA